MQYPPSKKDLLSIIEGNQLTPVFQPIFDLKLGQIWGYEALIRGSVDSGLHSPIDLFNLADKFGLTAELEYACCKSSCEAFVSMDGQGKLFINISPMILKNGFHNGHSLESLSHFGLDAEDIVFELSERYPINDHAELKESARQYRNQGFTLAVDDLGSGYSGLRVWEELRPNYVKIDRHFVENIDQDKAKQQFVRCLQKIAVELNCTVVAEGIETLEQMLTIRNLGVKLGQGFYLGTPRVDLKYTLPPGLIPKEEALTKLTTTHTAEDLVEVCVTIDPDLSFKKLIKLFRNYPRLRCAPVVSDGFVLGTIMRNDILELMASPYSHDLYGKRRAKHFMSSKHICVDSRTPLEEVGQIISARDEDELSHFVIVKKGYYLGVGRTSALLGQLTNMQLQAARYANPLTELPGNIAIDEAIDSWLSTKENFYVAYFDLNNFKPYNDHYGYKAGDNVIVTLAKIIQSLITHPQDFIGHVGGDDFVVLFRSETWESVCNKIISAFDRKVAEFYDDADIIAGGIEGIDRRGVKRFFPLIGLAIGVVHPDSGVINSHHEIGTLAADAKKEAKKQDGSSLFICRRRAQQSNLELNDKNENLEPV